jgi:hypothetical protein
VVTAFNERLPRGGERRFGAGLDLVKFLVADLVTHERIMPDAELLVRRNVTSTFVTPSGPVQTHRRWTRTSKPAAESSRITVARSHTGIDASASEPSKTILTLNHGGMNTEVTTFTASAVCTSSAVEVAQRVTRFGRRISRPGVITNRPPPCHRPILAPTTCSAGVVTPPRMLDLALGNGSENPPQRHWRCLGSRQALAHPV